MINPSLQMTRHGETGYKLGKLVADGLAKRQCELLLYTSNGYKGAEAAEAMDCATTTIRGIHKALHYKLGSFTPPEMIARAFELGFLRVATVALAWTIGFGFVGTSAPVAANDDTDQQNQQLRFRSRRGGRTRRTRDDGLIWDEETGELMLIVNGENQ